MYTAHTHIVCVCALVCVCLHNELYTLYNEHSSWAVMQFIWVHLLLLFVLRAMVAGFVAVAAAAIASSKCIMSQLFIIWEHFFIVYACVVWLSEQSSLLLLVFVFSSPHFQKHASTNYDLVISSANAGSSAHLRSYTDTVI